MFDRIDHLAPPTRASFGPSSSLFENIEAAWNEHTRVTSQYALEAEFSKLYADNLARAAELSGHQLENPLGDGLGSWEFAQNVLDLRLGTAPEAVRQAMQSYPWVSQFEQNEQLLAEMQQQFPEVKTFEQLLDDVRELRAEVEETAASAAARGGLVGAIGQFIGGTAGSFTLRDPALLGSMAIPGAGAGASLLRKMVVDGLIGAGVEGSMQFTQIQPTRALLGEDPTNPWASIAFAGVGGAAFRGAFEGAGVGYRALERQLYPDRVRAREFAQLLDNAPLQINTREILNTARGAALDPTARAARFGLEGEQALAAANPYGDTPQGRAVARQEFETFLREFEGLAPTTRPSTAVGRFLPEQEGFANAPDTPQAMMARLQEPELYQRLDEITLRVDEAQARLDEITGELEGRTMADAVGLLDESSGARVREIELELDNPSTPAARRAELERELDLVVESIGADRIARAASDTAIRPKHQLREARRTLKRLRQEQSRLLRPARELEESLAPRETVVEEGPSLGAQAADLNTRLEAEAPSRLEQAKAMVEAARAVDPAEAGPTGRVRVGGVDMDENFTFEIDEAGTAMSARQILDDLAEDDAMVEAMRVCSL